MRIALFTDTYLPQTNGVVSFLQNIIPQLSKGNDVILFAPGKGKRIRFQKRSKRFSICWVPASEFPYYEGYRMSAVVLKDLERILKDKEVDIVHAHAPVLLGLQGMLMAKRLKKPIVATYHTHLPDYLPYLLDGKFPGILNSISRKTVKGLIRIVYSMADVSTAPTQELASELRRYGIRNAVRLINGVDLKKLRSSKGLEKEFRQKHKIPGNRKIILYVGRVGFEKRLEVLLRACKRLRSRGWMLLVVGSGPNLENYKRQAKDLGLENAIFTGYLEDRLLPAAYSIADVFASASDSETFGLTFIEAMAFGTPAVGVDRLGPKELIANGKNGYLVKPGSSAGMAGKIDKLLSEPKLRARMGKEAKETAQKFSIEASFRETMSIYKELIKEKKKE